MKSLKSDRLPLFVTLITLLCLATPQRSWGRDISAITHACDNDESWDYSSKLPKSVREQLEALRNTANSQGRSFSDSLSAMDKAISLTRLDRSGEVKFFALYGMAKAYLTLGYPHLSYRLMEDLLNQSAGLLSAEQKPLQMALVGCLNGLARKYPSLIVREATLHALDNLGNRAKRSDIDEIQEAEFHFLQQEYRTHSQNNHLPKVLDKTGAFHDLALGWVASRRADQVGQVETVKYLSRFLSSSNSRSASYVPLARLLNGRTLALLKKFPEAAKELIQVSPSSNIIPDALADLGNVYEAMGDHSKAADTLTNLQIGLIAKSFLPEAQLQLARSLASLCQYPAAHRVLAAYNAKYQPVQSFLETVLKEESKTSLYHRMTDFLANSKTQAPGSEVAVLEWMRLPKFLAFQQELNLNLQELESAQTHEQEIQKLSQKHKLSQGTEIFLSSLQKFDKFIPQQNQNPDAKNGKTHPRP